MGMRNKAWSDLLMKRRFPLTSGASLSGVDTNEGKKSNEDESHHSSDEEEPYEAGDNVLVESICGSRLWDAKIVAVSKPKDSTKVSDVSYRVSYKSWSSRFDEWVPGD